MMPLQFLALSILLFLGTLRSAEAGGSPWYDDVGWFDLPDDAQDALKLLGYNGYRWDNCQSVSSDTMWWREFSDSERDAAEVLGWTADSWDNHDGSTFCSVTGEPRGEGPNNNNNNDNDNNGEEPGPRPDEPTPSPIASPTDRPSASPVESPPGKNDKEGKDNKEDEDEEENGDGDSINTPNILINVNQICQASANSMPHMAGRWRDGFPNDSLPTALCNNRILMGTMVIYASKEEQPFNSSSIIWTVPSTPHPLRR